LRYSASITCISSIMRPDRAKVISDYPHNADERAVTRQPRVFGVLVSSGAGGYAVGVRLVKWPWGP
jgi:hypothetical protein